MFFLARYKPFVITDPTERVPVCLENTVIFTMASFQYTGLAFALSIGPPYRKATYTNCKHSFQYALSCLATFIYLFAVPFLALLAIISFCNAYMILTPGDWLPPLLDFMGLQPPPSITFRVGILLLDFVYIAAVFFLEVCVATQTLHTYVYSTCPQTFVMSSRPFHQAIKVLRCKRRPNNPYKHVLASIDSTWPLKGEKTEVF